MICTSLTHGVDEYVTWPRTITQFREGKMTAIPPVHPWINRLGGRHYRAAGTEVDLTGLELATDPNGLPIHGNLLGAAFDVLTLEPARLVAQFDFGAHPDKLRAFPFPHVITIDARLDAERGLTLTTEVRATGDTPVPASSQMSSATLSTDRGSPGPALKASPPARPSSSRSQMAR